MSTILPVLRRSAIQTAKACLYRYNRIWNEGVDDMTDPALVGIGFHACAHQYIKMLVAGGLETDHGLADEAFPDGIAEALTPAHLVHDVRTIYMRWAEHFAVDLDAFLAAEERQDSAGQQFAPDLVYGRPGELEIKDFKTYRVALTEAQLRADFQARFYVYNAMRIWPNFPAYRFTHEYVRWGGFTTVVFEPGEVDDLADEVAAIAATIEEATRRNEWPATPGVECGWCQLKCPVADNPLAVPVRLNAQADAVKLGAHILAGETWLKKAKKTLKTYAAANGPVDVGGVVFDNRPSQTRTYPLSEVMAALEEWARAGASVGDLGLTLSHSALSRVFKAFPEIEQRLATHVQAKTTFRFSGKQPGVGDDEDE